VISGYLLASAALIITGARLGAMWGYRRVFLAGVGLFGAASLACGLAPDPVVLVAARVIQGIGGALAFPQVLSGIQRYFDEGPQRTRALGLYSMALAGGAVAGQILGGVLVSADVLGLRWRPVFLVNVPVTLAVVLAGVRVFPADGPADSPADGPDDGLDGRARRLDVPGAATLAGAVLAIVVPLALGRQAGWPAWTWWCLAASLPASAAFVVIEQRRAARGRPLLIAPHLLRRPAIAWGLWPAALTTSTYFALLFTLALYLQRGLGRTAMVSGLTLLPWVIAFAVPGRVLGRLPARTRSWLTLPGCLILAAVYIAISASMFTGGCPQAVLLVLLALGGLGLGTTFSTTLVRLTTAATPRYAADISGVLTTSLQIAGAIGVAAFGTLYLSRITGPGAPVATHAFGIVTAAFALVAVLAAAAAYRAGSSTRPHPGREERIPGPGETPARSPSGASSLST